MLLHFENRVATSGNFTSSIVKRLRITSATILHSSKMRTRFIPLSLETNRDTLRGRSGARVEMRARSEAYPLKSISRAVAPHALHIFRRMRQLPARSRSEGIFRSSLSLSNWRPTRDVHMGDSFRSLRHIVLNFSRCLPDGCLRVVNRYVWVESHLGPFRDEDGRASKRKSELAAGLASMELTQMYSRGSLPHMVWNRPWDLCSAIIQWTMIW